MALTQMAAREIPVYTAMALTITTAITVEAGTRSAGIT